MHRLKKLHLDLHPFRFSIETDSQLTYQNLIHLYPPELISEDPDKLADYSVRLLRSQGLRKYLKPQVNFHADCTEPFRPLKLSQSYAFCEWGMNYMIAANEMQHVIVHSAALAIDNQAIVFPAPPGSGKSTLTSYLSHHGWRLLTDEMTLITPNSLTLTPFVRPICLKNNSIELAKSWFKTGQFSSIAKDTHKGDVIHLSPPKDSWQLRKQPATIKAIVFPKYSRDIQLDIYALNKTQAFMQLADNAFNFGVLKNQGFLTLSQIIDQVDSYEVYYNDIEQLKDFLIDEIINHD